MGICQSQLNAESGNNNDFVVKENQPRSPSLNKMRPSVSSPKNFTFTRKLSANPSSKKGFDVSLISPAERTEATDLDSPYASIFSSPYTPGTTDELMDIDDASSAAEAESFSDPNNYSASYQRPENFLLGDVEDDDFDEYEPAPFDEYELSNEPVPSAPMRVDTPTVKETRPQSPSSSIKKRLQTMMMKNPRHDVPDTPTTTSSLLAPPKEIVVGFDSESASTKASVNPQTLASFNKLKTQARLAAKLEKERKQKEKIKDRRLDIHGYKNLWEEYSGIQNRMSQQLETKLESRSGGSESISLTDSNTWFVDFGAIQAENHLDDIDVDHNIYEDDDNRSQASLSLLSETNMQVQKRLFREKAFERRRQGGAYSIGSKTGDLTSHKSIDITDDEEPFDCRVQSAAVGSKRLDSFRGVSSKSCASMSDSFAYLEDDAASDDSNKSITVDENASIVSDLDNSMIDTADYRVLHQYRFKSIESTVPGIDDHLVHVTDFSLPHEALKDTEAFLDAPTPKVQNNAPISIASYMEDLYLPSVSIENAETGEVRWRQFPKTDVKAKTARKLDFCPSEEDNKKARLEIADKTGFQSDPERHLRDKCVTIPSDHLYLPMETATPLKKEPDVGNPPKIKTFDPVISKMSKEAFLRVSTWNSAREPKRESQQITKEKPLPVSTTNPSVTTENRVQSTKRSAVVAKLESKKLTARKVSSKIDQLVSQLYEEHATTRAST